MQNELEYKDNELHGLYDKCKYRSLIAYISMLTVPDFALHRFYLGDDTSRRIAIYFISINFILFISFGIIFDWGTACDIDVFIILIFMLFDIFFIPAAVKNNNFQLIKNLKKLESVQFQNRQMFWNYFIPIILILKILVYFHPELEYMTIMSIIH